MAKGKRYAARTPTEELLDKCAVYLNNSFHKFSLTNKIKISLEIFKRSMPTSPLVDNSQHNHYVVFRNPQSLKEENGITPRAEVKDAQLSPR